MLFSNILKRKREEKGLTQAEVAKKMHVSQAAVHRWETGDTRIARKHHKGLARLYKCTVDELFAGGEEDAKTGSQKNT